MWFIVDGFGIALSSLTWVLFGLTDWVVSRYVIEAWFSASSSRLSWVPLTDAGTLIFLIYQALLFMSWLSHFQAMTTDPGTIAPKEAPENFTQPPRACRLCADKWKPPRAHHCKTCKTCIFRMDHHCPWVNNCVGLSNQKFFILFLCYTALSAVTTLLILLVSAVCWVYSQKSWSDATPPGSAALVLSGLVAVECLAVLLFVSDFLQEQIEAIQTNSTLVETFQRTHGARGTVMDHARTIFGHRYWLWLCPVRSAPPADYTEVAIPDEADSLIMMHQDESAMLGIASDDDTTTFRPLLSGAPSDVRQRHAAGARVDGAE